MPDRQWYRSAHYNEVRKPAGVNHCVASNFDSPPDGWRDELCVHRDVGDAPFTPRQQKMLHLFHLESDWVYRPAPAPADPQVARLAPRVKRVLDLLLAGDGEKQVATKLGLSRHTVHQYVKMLYRELEVSSRAELMARCLRR